MNFCINCKHFISSELGEEHSKCARAFIHTQSLISGKPIVIPSYCKVEREFASGCGPSGKYFQAKEAAA